MYQCDDQHSTFKGSYLQTAIIIPLLITLHLLLLSNTLYHEHKDKHQTSTMSPNKTKQNPRRNSLKLRVSSIILQILALLWLISDLFRFVIDPVTSYISNHSILCNILSYIPQIIPSIFSCIFLYHILLRLYISFKGSHLALCKFTYHTCLILITIPHIIHLILFHYFNKNSHCCLISWQPMDGILINQQFIQHCDVRINDKAQMILISGIIWHCMLYMYFCLVFTRKLLQLLSTNPKTHDIEEIKWKFKSLIVKNCILSTLGAVSTLFGYFLWISTYKMGFGVVLLHIDMFINCTVIILMFDYNEKWYKSCCKLCIYCCFMECDKSYDKSDENQYNLQRRNIELYLAQNVSPNTDNSTNNITNHKEKSSTHWTTTGEQTKGEEETQSNDNDQSTVNVSRNKNVTGTGTTTTTTTSGRSSTRHGSGGNTLTRLDVVDEMDVAGEDDVPALVINITDTPIMMHYKGRSNMDSVTIMARGSIGMDVINET